MTVCFAPVNDRHGKKKDTLINVEETKQFVVNLATEANAEKMNQTSAPYPYGVSEFEKAGLTPLPSIKIKPPRVAESPAAKGNHSSGYAMNREHDPSPEAVKQFW